MKTLVIDQVNIKTSSSAQCDWCGESVEYAYIATVPVQVPDYTLEYLYDEYRGTKGKTYRVKNGEYTEVEPAICDPCVQQLAKVKKDK
jgi:hypothetical protein